jgi:hypothetical protein
MAAMSCQVRLPVTRSRNGWPTCAHLRCLLITGPGVSLLRPLPEPDKLPDLTPGGFCPGSAEPITQ